MLREDRPYLALNMVSTPDGKATVDGRTRAISSETDRELFHDLRTQADAVMAGAGPSATERYGRIVKNDELRAKRGARGAGARPARRDRERAARPSRRTCRCSRIPESSAS